MRVMPLASLPRDPAGQYCFGLELDDIPKTPGQWSSQCRECLRVFTANQDTLVREVVGFHHGHYWSPVQTSTPVFRVRFRLARPSPDVEPQQGVLVRCCIEPSFAWFATSEELATRIPALPGLPVDVSYGLYHGQHNMIPPYYLRTLVCPSVEHLRPLLGVVLSAWYDLQSSFYSRLEAHLLASPGEFQTSRIRNETGLRLLRSLGRLVVGHLETAILTPPFGIRVANHIPSQLFDGLGVPLRLEQLAPA